MIGRVGPRATKSGAICLLRGVHGELRPASGWLRLCKNGLVFMTCYCVDLRPYTPDDTSLKPAFCFGGGRK